MYWEGEDLFYCIALYNDTYPMAHMPAGCADGILKGIYRFKASENKKSIVKVQLFGSGPILIEATKAQAILDEKYGVAADVLSVTSYNELRREALSIERWNRRPAEWPKTPYIQTVLDGAEGPTVAASDFMKSVQDRIAPWLPGRMVTLGTGGFGRSDNREHLRRHFEVNAAP